MLNIKSLSSLTRILTFDDGISLVLILGDQFVFLCDTHLGPESMYKVMDYLKDKLDNKKLIIFNSHSDWDHIWGNCAFPDAIIISHTSCRIRIKERGEFDLNRMSSLVRGKVTLLLPNLTFERRLIFNDEGVEFIYAPGHTIDSSICFNRKEGILYLGDLVENPIPYLDYEDLEVYLKTLDMLKNLPADIIVSAHSGIITRNLVNSNIRYIRMVMEGVPVDTRTFGEYRSVHQINQNTLMMFRFEKLTRDVLKERFNFGNFWSIVPDMAVIDTYELERVMEKYLKEIH
jgi:cyclase